MSLIVQKFGGTSVADTDKITAAARKAIRAQHEGCQVVMVVSAMGKNTDKLVKLARKINERPPAREMDMLLSTGEQVSVALMAMAVEAAGYRAVSLTGAQIGIRTDSTHTKARIRTISTERMRALLNEGNIVIAAGFQGIDEDYNITTLGRGGSDTTAVALAAVLQADACEIYTDVDGVYTTDPRALPEARRVSRISYDEMLELASLGAGVMHNRSIEFAKKYGVPIHVRSSFSDTPGTIIAAAQPQQPQQKQLEQADKKVQPVVGAALTKNEARVTISNVPDVPGVSLAIFSSIASRNVTVDMIVQNVGSRGKADISFTVPQEELDVTLDALGKITPTWDGVQVSHDDQVSKVSVVGLGMARQVGVADKLFRALASENINIQMITTSEIKISVLVAREEARRALQAAHRTFALEKEPPITTSPDTSALAQHTDAAVRPADAVDVVARLQDMDMEELVIDDIALDQSQARITIHGVPDTPGVAAKIFDEVAAAGIFVDMIVQSYSGAGQASLSFTVPKTKHDKSVSVAKKLAQQFDCRQVTSSPDVAKLSVSGIGLRSHTGVAICMFRALSEAGINVGMINTSEVRVNVVVEGQHGEQGLKSLEQAFAQARG